MATGDKLANLADLKVVKDYTDAQLATVDTALAAKAPLASPALTGNPTAPTQTAGNNSTRIATTAFVKTAVDTVDGKVSDLKSAIKAVELLSDGSTLLSDSMSDKTGSSSNVDYSLTDNVLTVSGTATGGSLFAMLGSTTAAPPSWMVGGGKYFITIDNNAPGCEIRLQCKQTSNTSIHGFAPYFTQSGTYIFEVPSDITVFRLAAYVNTGVTVDGTVTVEISRAVELKGIVDDLEDIGDDVDAIQTDYLKLADASATIPDNTDFNTYTTPGTYKVTNNTHAGTMTNIPITMSGKLLVMALSQTARLYQIYAATVSIASTYVRYYNGSSWSSWQRIAYKQAGYVKYTEGSFEDGKATAELDVYIPASVGYLKYIMYHYVNTAADQNYDVWRICSLSTVGDLSDSSLVTITEPGEWECAVHLGDEAGKERKDFSGGSTHGDEIMTGDPTVLLNGTPVALSSLTTMKPFNELSIIRTSELYDPADHETVIADHGVRYVFDISGLKIHQSLKWKIAAPLTNCFMCMFLPGKTKIDRAMANCDFKTMELPSDNEHGMDAIAKSNANAVYMWDTSSHVSADISVPTYPTGLTGGDQMSISNNKSSTKPLGNNYNKLYFKICGGGNCTVGELWKTTSVYKVDYYA